MSTIKNGAEIAVRQTAALATPDDMPPQVFALFERALAQGETGVNALKELVALQDSIQRRRAELEFSTALAAFQDSCPPVTKSSEAKIVTKSGGGYGFTYADLETIIGTARPHLSANGFSFTFDSTCTGAMLTCICTLRHAAGHSMSASFTLPTENSSGASAQQKMGGANTYAKRQCLMSILGLSLSDADPDDGRPAVATITDEQAATLAALMDETGVGAAAFCARFKLASVADLPATMHAEAVRLLEKKRKAVQS